MNFSKEIENYLGGEEVAKMLIANGAKVNSNDKHKYTPLHMAGEFSEYIFKRDKKWVSILSYFIKMLFSIVDKVNLTKLLIESGAEIDVKNENGITPLLYSALCGIFEEKP